MCTRILRVAFLASVPFLAGACATAEEWAEWGKHPTHFASGDHAFFSFRNTEGRTPWVTRADVEAARRESWWGKAITVRPEQILER